MKNRWDKSKIIGINSNVTVINLNVNKQILKLKD